MRMQGLFFFVGLCVSGTAFAEDNGVWVHIKDAKDVMVLGTTHGHPPATYPRGDTANSAIFQVSFADGGVQLQDAYGRYLRGAEGDRLMFEEAAPTEPIELVRHYDGKVSFILGKRHLYVDEKGDVRTASMAKASPEAIFDLVELDSETRQVATGPTKLDCRPAAIQQIRADFGKTHNNASLVQKEISVESGPGWGESVKHRYRDGVVVEEHVHSFHEAVTANIYTYYTADKAVYFQYKIIEDHKDEQKRQIRRYYDQGKPCRCLSRHGDREANFMSIVDKQYDCAKDPH